MIVWVDIEFFIPWAFVAVVCILAFVLQGEERCEMQTGRSFSTSCSGEKVTEAIRE
jgi:hypothetical protein